MKSLSKKQFDTRSYPIPFSWPRVSNDSTVKLTNKALAFYITNEGFKTKSYIMMKQQLHIFLRKHLSTYMLNKYIKVKYNINNKNIYIWAAKKNIRSKLTILKKLPVLDDNYILKLYKSNIKSVNSTRKKIITAIGNYKNKYNSLGTQVNNTFRKTNVLKDQINFISNIAGRCIRILCDKPNSDVYCSKYINTMHFNKTLNEFIDTLFINIYNILNNKRTCSTNTLWLSDNLMDVRANMMLDTGLVIYTIYHLNKKDIFSIKLTNNKTVYFKAFPEFVGNANHDNRETMIAVISLHPITETMIT